MSQMNQEIEPFSLDDPIWASFLQDISGDLGECNVIPVHEMGEDKRKTVETRKGKGKIVRKGEEISSRVRTEKDRRKIMGNMFTSLQSLLPKLPPKPDKITVVDETISYIKRLETNLKELERKKEVMLAKKRTTWVASLPSREPFRANKGSSSTTTMNNSTAVAIKTWKSPNVVLNICGNIAHFVVYAPKKSGFVTTICCVFEKHGLEVVSTNVCSEADRRVYTIQARVAKGIIDNLFPELINDVDIFMQAAVEMAFWISP